MPEAEYTNDQGEHEMNVKLHEFFPFKGKKNAKSQSKKWLHKPITIGRGMFLPGH